jgi:hypothetical protein
MRLALSVVLALDALICPCNNEGDMRDIDDSMGDSFQGAARLVFLWGAEIWIMEPPAATRRIQMEKTRGRTT